jgi:putative SOS response-associated peptidase YedK
MCGRFVQKSDLSKILPIFKAVLVESDVLPSYNITPRQPVAVVMEKGQRKIVTMKWGLIPHWAKDETIANKLINARSETVFEKPSFRDSVKKRRCLIIADGFYEWQGVGLSKKPFYICKVNDEPFGMAGLYDVWINAAGEKVSTCTIVTTGANKIMEPIHHRMPVILGSGDFDLWLNSENDYEKIKGLLKPCEAELLKASEVSLLVNNPRNNSPECILPPSSATK